MAEKDATVQIEEEGVVTVDVTDDPALAAAADGGEAEAAEAKPAKAAKERPAATAKQNVADEAAAALTQAVKTADDARKASDATALAERRRADEAVRLAAQKDQEAKGYREQVESQELTIISTGIENAKREVQSAKQEWRAAQEAGEFDKAADAQERLAKSAAALDRLEDAKANYESGARKTTTTEGRVDAPQGQPLSAFERYVSSFAPSAQAWLRTHPECVPAEVGGDKVKNSKMMAGHYDALAQNLEQGTPEYFRVIEEHTGHREPVSAAAATVAAGADDGAAAPKPAARQRVAQPSAPVSRDPPSANGARSTRSVSLNKDQQDAAKMSWPNKTPQEAFALYARNLIELEAEGKIGRTSH
jgi:hypothetical protein